MFRALRSARESLTYYVSEEEIFVHNMCSAIPLNSGSNAINTTNKIDEVIKHDFIVTPKGTVMDTSKNYNLVGTGEKGDWFQIHNFGKAEDIDYVDELLRNGTMTIRKGKR